MSERLQLTLSINQDLKKFLSKKYPEIVDFRILSEALDARGANQGKIPKFNYTLEVIKLGEKFQNIKEEFKYIKTDVKPIIVGAGPAGLFAALRLAEYGIQSTVIERGDRAKSRMKKIARHWRYGEFDSETNVCFGEGGAGLFSDGKLITRVKSPYISYVMNKLVDFGAPEEIAYQTNPHLGSNKIRVLIEKITDYLEYKNVKILTGKKVSNILFKGDKTIGVELDSGEKVFSEDVILATGHSADDIYQVLKENQVNLIKKDFAIGVRVEHPRKEINRLQYGSFDDHPKLDTARYRLSYHIPEEDRGCYSFCMCPGGYVLSSGTDEDGIVVNGMSNYKRNSPWSNSAFVITIKSGEDFEFNDVLDGMKFQRNIEKNAYDISKKYRTGKEIPSQLMKDFMKNKISNELIKNSCPSDLFSYDMNELFPQFVSDSLKKGFEKFNKFLPGFISDNAILMAPETRTSAPLTIERDKFSLESTSHRGLYPCGEGAGYAGGITSAAIDGIKVAEKIVQKIEN